MELAAIEKSLIKAFEEFEVIDCHEHLAPEKERTDKEVDVFSLFTTYTHWEFLSSGMSEEDYQSLFNRSIPLEKRWETLKPYWEHIRWSSYAHAILIAIKKFYDCDDINEKTIKPISDAIKKFNKPGIY
ncbi:MAG: hypothetical protein HY350_03585, partial [Candidatus Omnitrophica bacterium]|nr:hypothetical protein [Candidatus Omnitrophota bacterium]